MPLKVRKSQDSYQDRFNTRTQKQNSFCAHTSKCYRATPVCTTGSSGCLFKILLENIRQVFEVCFLGPLITSSCASQLRAAWSDARTQILINCLSLNGIKRSRFLQNITFVSKRMRWPMCLKRCLRFLWFFFSPGKKLGYTFDNRNFHNVSLGQGQEVIAEQALELAAKEGHWVILQVQYHSVTFMPHFRANGQRCWAQQICFCFFCKHVDDIVCNMTPLPRNILSFALNLCNPLNFCITRVPRNQPIGM